MKRNVRCSHCGYKYETGTDKVLVTCASCGLKFNVKECTIK